MKDSSTYQAIVEEGRQEGRIQEAREFLLQWGTELLGQPSKRVQSTVTKIADLDRLKALTKRLPTVESWPALLADAPSE